MGGVHSCSRCQFPGGITHRVYGLRVGVSRFVLLDICGSRLLPVSVSFACGSRLPLVGTMAIPFNHMWELSTSCRINIGSEKRESTPTCDQTERLLFRQEGVDSHMQLNGMAAKGTRLPHANQIDRG
jgi:hypothetical protein